MMDLRPSYGKLANTLCRPLSELRKKKGGEEEEEEEKEASFLVLYFVLLDYSYSYEEEGSRMTETN